MRSGCEALGAKSTVGWKTWIPTTHPHPFDGKIDRKFSDCEKGKIHFAIFLKFVDKSEILAAKLLFIMSLAIVDA